MLVGFFFYLRKPILRTCQVLHAIRYMDAGGCPERGGTVTSIEPAYLRYCIQNQKVVLLLHSGGQSTCSTTCLNQSHIWGKLVSEPFQCQGPEGTGSAAVALMFEKWPIKLSKLSLEKWLEVEVEICLQIRSGLSHGPGSLDTSFANLILLIMKHS